MISPRILTIASTLLTIVFATPAFASQWKDRYPKPIEIPGTFQRIETFEAEAKRLLPVCIASLEKRFKRAWPRRNSELEGFTLHLARDRDSATRCKGEGAGCTGGSQHSLFIELQAQPFISGAQDLQLTVCHEAVHAYFRKQMTGTNYGKLPRWAREGVAVYLAGQLDSKVASHLYRNLENPLKKIDGLEGAHSLEDYFEDGLAFELLDLKHRALLPVLTAVLNGADLYEAIQAVTSLRKGEFLAQAKAYAIDRLSAQKAALPTELVEADALMAWSKRSVARGKLATLLERSGVRLSPTGRIEGALTTPIASALARVAEIDRWSPSGLDGAHAIFRELLDRLPEHSYAESVANLRYSLAWTHARRGELRESLLNYMRVFAEHDESPNLQDSSTLAIARVYFELAEYAMALPWLEAQILVGNHIDLEILYLRALSHFHLCRQDEALELLEKVASNPTSEKWAKRAENTTKEIHSGILTPASRCVN